MNPTNLAARRQAFERIEFKSLAFELKDGIADDGSFEGYAAVFGNLDGNGDIIEKGAFKKTLRERKTVPILWQHDPYEPIGVSTAMAEEDFGLAVKGQLVLGVSRANEARALMQAKALGGLSIGYEALKAKFGERGDEFARKLLEIRLWEFSPVTFPANDLAAITAVKSYLSRISDGTLTEQETAEITEAGESVERLVLDLKEGRVLSGANRALLARVATGLDEHSGSLRALLVETDLSKSLDDEAAETKVQPDEPTIESLATAIDALRAIRK